jgi:N-acetylglucosaminylphosphatidylinositol deacetylase
VIAHPDDEAMFFTPAIVNLRESNNLHLLCLSSGDYAGLGRTREKELDKAANMLGFKSV